MNRKGFSLLEVLIAGVLLAGLVGYVSVSMTSSKKALKRSLYHYVALNLARSIMESGASNVSHQHGFRYYYTPASSNTIPPSLDCCPPPCSGTLDTSGYAIKEWRCFQGANVNVLGSNPVSELGDIESRGLVPKQNPHSVEIYYESAADPVLSTPAKTVYKQYVSIAWEEDGTKHLQEYSAIPSAQVNDILQLQIKSFGWQ